MTLVDEIEALDDCARCGFPKHRHSGGSPNTCPIIPTYEPRIAAEREKVLVEALKACRAWHYAENKFLGDFKQRGDLCAYSEWITQKALGFIDEDYKPVPAIFGEGTSAKTIATWVNELIADETRQALTKVEQRHG